MAEQTVKLSILPENFDRTITDLRNVGQNIDRAMDDAAKASTRLGRHSSALKELLAQNSEELKRQQEMLHGLAQEYMGAVREGEKYGTVLDEINRKMEAIREEGIYHRDDTRLRDLARQYGMVSAQQDRAYDRANQLGMAISAGSATMIQGTGRALSGLTTQANRFMDTVDKFGGRGAKSVDTIAAGLLRTQKATMGANMAMSSFNQLMRGNLVGAFRSGARSARTLWAAFGAGISTATVATGGLLAALGALYWTHRKNVQVAAEYADRIKRINAVGASVYGTPTVPVATMSDADLSARRDRLRSRAASAQNDAQNAIVDANVAAASAGTTGWMGALAGLGKRADQAVADMEAKAKKAKGLRDELKEVEAEIKKREKAIREARTKEAYEDIANHQKEIAKKNADAWEERFAETEDKKGKLARLAQEEDFIRANGGREGELSHEAKVRLRAIRAERDAELARQRKERDEEEMGEMNLAEKQEYLKKRISESWSRAEHTGRKIDEETAKEYERQLKTVEESIKKIGDTRKEQALEYRRDRAFEEKSEKDKLEYLQKEAQYLRVRMAAETDPEKRGKIWDRLFENRKRYDELNESFGRNGEKRLTGNQQSYQLRDSGLAGFFQSLREQLGFQAGQIGKEKSLLKRWELQDDMYGTMLEARERIATYRESNMTWVDRKKARRAAKAQARADREAVDEMEKFLDDIDGGGEGGNTLRARSARRMGGKLTGFSRHPNDMASRSAARMAAMRSGTLRDYKPGAQGPHSASKSDEAKGIDKTNNLLEEIRDALA